METEWSLNCMCLYTGLNAYSINVNKQTNIYNLYG